MQEATPQTSALTDDDDARLASLGYSPQLNRVLGLFSNFSVAFTYLSPVVGIYSLFAYGLGFGGPAYMWTTLIPVAGMLLVALIFGELASHYPIAGAIYQYSKYNVGRRYGWFVGWFYGIALLVTVASVDTGVVPYFVRAGEQLVRLEHRPGQPPDDPDHHAGAARHPDSAEHHRRQGDGAGRAGRRLRRDPRHDRRRDRAGHPRVPPRLRLPVQHRGRGERRRPTRSGSTSAARISAC